MSDEAAVQTTSAVDWLLANKPVDEPAARAAAEALLRHRDDVEALAQLRALTPFERQLAERAYDAGVSSMRTALNRVVGTGAETVRADSLRALPDPVLRFRTLPPFPMAAEVRAARLVAAAREAAEREAPGASRTLTAHDGDRIVAAIRETIYETLSSHAGEGAYFPWSDALVDAVTCRLVVELGLVLPAADATEATAR